MAAGTPGIERFAGMRVVGLPLRTSNAETSRIRAHWERFYAEGMLERIPGRFGSGVVAVYTRYDGDHTMPYTLVVGARVEAASPVPAGVDAVEVPAQAYARFTAKGAPPEAVVAAWNAVWAAPFPRSYHADFEVYMPNGVDVFVGVDQAPHPHDAA